MTGPGAEPEAIAPTTLVCETRFQNRPVATAVDEPSAKPTLRPATMKQLH